MDNDQKDHLPIISANREGDIRRIGRSNEPRLLNPQHDDSHNITLPKPTRLQKDIEYSISFIIIVNVFVIGGLFYTFVAYGSFGLINRHPLSGSGDIVEDYFVGNKW